MFSSYGNNVFADEVDALLFLEQRIWPGEIICPRCDAAEMSSPLCGSSTRLGVYKCYCCRRPFTVKAGTIFEGSKLPITVWFKAMVLIYSSEYPPSVRCLAKEIGVSHKTSHVLLKRVQKLKKSDRVTPFHERSECCIAVLDRALIDVVNQKSKWIASDKEY